MTLRKTHLQTIYFNSYPERVKAMEIDVKKAKFFSYANILGGAVGSVWSLMTPSEWSIGYGFLGFGIAFRIYTHFLMEKTLVRLRKEAEVDNVIET